MRKWKATFNGREVGAIGVFSDFEIIVAGVDEEAARLAIYETHEHLRDVKLRPVEHSTLDPQRASLLIGHYIEVDFVTHSGTKRYHGWVLDAGSGEGTEAGDIAPRITLERLGGESVVEILFIDSPFSTTTLVEGVDNFERLDDVYDELHDGIAEVSNQIHELQCRKALLESRLARLNIYARSN